MGQDQKLGQQGDASSRQRVKRRRWMKLALIPGRLLVAAWALGGDLDHLDTSWTVVFCSILVAKLGRYGLDGRTASWGKTGWTIRCKGKLLKVLFQSGVPWERMKGPALFSISMLI